MTTDARMVGHHVPVTRMTLATWDPDQFKTAYRSQGLTLQQVSVTSGIPYSAVRKYSAGSASPTPERLRLLAESLGVPTTALAPLREPCTLHELRWHTGLTVAELARRVGYSLSHARLILTGVSPITEPDRWAVALNVSKRQLSRAWEASRAEQNPGTGR